MARITAEIDLRQFHLRKQNDDGPDEPYVLLVYARLDGALNDPAVPAAERKVPLHFPEGMGHGDLGPDSKGMSRSGTSSVSVPAAIGKWTTALDSTHLDAAPALLQQAGIAIGVVFLEEDSTLDSTVRAMIPEIAKQARKRVNAVLRVFLGVFPDISPGFPHRDEILEAFERYRAELLGDGFDPNGLIDGEALIDHVLAQVLPTEIGKAIGKILIPGGAELWNAFAAFLQFADRDELLGSDGRRFTFYDLVGRAHAPEHFEVESRLWTSLPGNPDPIVFRDTTKGVYAIEGVVRRTDADEPPVVAALRGPGQRAVVFARRTDGDFFQMRRTPDFGQTFDVGNQPGTFSSGRFRSGPAAASADGGRIQLVAGLGQDEEIWFGFSIDGGASWHAWFPISQRKTFRGAPAVAVSTDGDTFYVAGRDAENAYWLTRTANRGGAWAPWARIGAGVFHSSPAMVCVRELALAGVTPPDALVVAGLGTDKRVWSTRFSDSESVSEQGWTPIAPRGAGHTTTTFTSAPAMATDGARHVLLTCRAGDLRYWRVASSDGGRRFGIPFTWVHVGRPEQGEVRYQGQTNQRSGDLQAMYSAPAVVLGDDGTRLLFGLSPTLGLWCNRCPPNQVVAWRPTTAEPEPGFRPHYY